MTKKAFLLINVAMDKEKDRAGVKAKQICASIRQIKGVESAHIVTGPYEIIAVMKAEDLGTMGNVITTQIAQIPGIEVWTACVEIASETPSRSRAEMA